MYRLAMDQDTRQDIAAAAAAHRELGRDYDGAIAESLIDRIGDEIDRRVDARLGSRSRRPVSAAGTELASKRRAYWTGIAVGSGITSIPGLIFAARGSEVDARGILVMTAVLWAVISLVYVIARRARD
jgi:hypothetical protein